MNSHCFIRKILFFVLTAFCFQTISNPFLIPLSHAEEREALTLSLAVEKALKNNPLIRITLSGREIADGRMGAEEADKPFRPAVFCIGDMGHAKEFYIHFDAWYGGKLSVFKMGHTFYAMKLAFKEMYYRIGGKIPSWGIPLSELVADTLV